MEDALLPVVGSTERWKPWCAPSEDCGTHSDSLDICDCSGTPKRLYTSYYQACSWLKLVLLTHSNVCRKGWLDAGLPLPSFQRFDESRLLATNVRPRPTVQVQVKVVPCQYMANQRENSQSRWQSPIPDPQAFLPRNPALYASWIASCSTTAMRSKEGPFTISP